MRRLAFLCFLASMPCACLFAGVAQAVTVTAPTISGRAQQGMPLAVNNSAPNPPTAAITDDWELCTGLSCGSPVATGATYTPTAADVGQAIVVVETATDNSVTPAQTASASSVPTPAVLPAAPVSTRPPAIWGVVQQGQVLSLAEGSWTNAPTSVTDVWEVCTGAACSAVFTGDAYTVAATDVGHTVEVVETAANAGGTASVTSIPVGPAVPPVPVVLAAPSISGGAQQGQTLALTQGAWTNGPSLIADQWMQCDPTGASCTPIPGQTGLTYTPTASDVGHALGVLETSSNPGGSGLAARSALTPVVTATSITSIIAFSATNPNTNQTVTLVATVSSSSSDAHPAGSVTFLNGAAGIVGCIGKGIRGGQVATVVCQTSFPAGTAIVSAAYVPGGGSLVTASTSQPTALAIDKDSTSVSLAVTKRVPLGTRATYTATVVPPVSNSGPIHPTGSIQFLDRGQPIGRCLGQPLTNLTATCTVKYRSPGGHSISASYAGDANFAPSGSSTSSVRIVKASAARIVLGFVASTLQWTFGYHRTYTQVIFLEAFGIANGTRVTAACEGTGCPFRKLRSATSTGGTLDLLPLFRHRRLRAGARITVRLTHPHWVGKFYSFTMRGSRPPVVVLSCLAVDRTIPGVGC